MAACCGYWQIARQVQKQLGKPEVLEAELEARVLSTAKVLLASKQCTADAEIGSAEQLASTSAEQPIKKLNSAHAIGTSSVAQPAPTSAVDDVNAH